MLITVKVIVNSKNILTGLFLINTDCDMNC